MSLSSAVFLVRHRGGHCVVRDGFFPDGQDLVATLCGTQVVMPFGISEDPGLLDCRDCLGALAPARLQAQLTE